MSRDKHIEEMARDIYENTNLSVVEIAENIAEHLYEQGYRKVDEDYARQCTCYTLGCQIADTLEKKVAREIFAEIDKRLSVDENGFNAIAEEGLSEGHAYCETYVHNLRAHLADLKKKYESEGADDEANH